MNAILAIDGGGTRTRAGLYDEEGNLLAEAEGDATNLTMTPPVYAVRTIADLAATLTGKTGRKVGSVVAGISGAGRTGHAGIVATGLAKALGTDDVRVCSDAHMLAWANLDKDHPILVIAGTGSSVITRRPDGTRVVTGGWGPILGDEGGAYRLALEGIRRADEDGSLRDALVGAADSGTLPRLYQWLSISSTTEIAELAAVVTSQAAAGNPGARAALRDQAERLAEVAKHGLQRVGIGSGSTTPLRIIVTGGLMECSLYADAFSAAMMHDEYAVSIEPPRLAGHRAAFALRTLPIESKFIGRPQTDTTSPTETTGDGSTEGALDWVGNLDEAPAEEIAVTMSRLDSTSLVLVSRMHKSIGALIDAAATCLHAGGRIIYAGAGTSGRLGVLDASECPPTFGVDEGRVIGLIAGGDAALRHSIEGAEDDIDAARRDIDAIAPPVGANDLVIGITASGTTPYALAAIDRAKELGAKTGLVACNPVPLDRADHVIALDTGPEVLPGSTRLKAGTATKIVLNQISTGAMAKAGYVFEGRMVGVRPLNKKLRQRCIRIIAELTKEDEAAAEKRLDETGGSIRLAVLMARKGLTLEEARRRLDAAHGVLRDALEAK